MNIALILAGGSGSRMGLEIPKQFCSIQGKPILVYTLESFQNHPQVDAIGVVCIDGWQEAVASFGRQYGIRKLKWIIPGGETCQESIRNGVFYLEKVAAVEDIIVIHDGIRPLVEPSVLTDVIGKCQKYGNAVSSLPYNEQIFLVDPADPSVSAGYIPREGLRRVSTPQAYRFDLLDEKYHEAFASGIGIHGSAYANTMMAELGVALHFAAGSEKNIKLTSREDLALFRAYLRME